jgi:hypothetical protein
LRNAAESPERVLQAFSQSDEAFVAEHDAHMLPTRKNQAEVVEPVLERSSGNADPERQGVGEIR